MIIWILLLFKGFNLVIVLFYVYVISYFDVFPIFVIMIVYC